MRPHPRPGGGLLPGTRPGGVVINRPGGGNIINRPGGGNVINRPNININRPTNITNTTINNTVTNTNINRVTNIHNRPVVVNRPVVGLRPGMPSYWGGAVGGGVVGYPVPVYPSGFDPGYAGAVYPAPVPNYAPMTGYAGGYGQDYSSPYADFDNGWRRNFWGGFGDVASTVISGLAAAATSRRTTVVYQNPYQEAPTLVAPAAAAPAAPPPPRELDYSKPIEVPTAKETANLDEEIVQLGMKTFEQARAEFKKGEYTLAQGDAEKAIRLVPGDTTIHEVRALAQFAQKKYQDSAGTLYAVLSTAPGSSWDTIGALYPDPAAYQKQLKALEDSIREGANEPWRHFLLAYHYMVLDEREAALGEFRESARLNDKDQVSPRMVALLEKALGKDPTKEGAKEAPKKEEK